MKRSFGERNEPVVSVRSALEMRAPPGSCQCPPGFYLLLLTAPICEGCLLPRASESEIQCWRESLTIRQSEAPDREPERPMYFGVIEEEGE